MHLLAIFTQQALGFFQFSQGDGANIGAVGIAKKHHHHFAFEFGQRAQFACAIGQAKTLGVVDARDIAGVEVRSLRALRLRFAGGQDQQSCGGQGTEQGRFQGFF